MKRRSHILFATVFAAAFCLAIVVTSEPVGRAAPDDDLDEEWPTFTAPRRVPHPHASLDWAHSLDEGAFLAEP